MDPISDPIVFDIPEYPFTDANEEHVHRQNVLRDLDRDAEPLHESGGFDGECLVGDLQKVLGTKHLVQRCGAST
ncbi:hypothetical protein QE152_g27457 [Popillia japonica]|uniref:Uncharacterized protein n=1 Tax=Popillia japonica TaxID=7064 RepID=A0AAW1JUN1_POPJA